MVAPDPAKRPIEKKVSYASAATYLGLVVGLTVLEAVSKDASLISGLPDWAEALLLPIVPTAITFLTGYKTAHTPRPDLGQP